MVNLKRIHSVRLGVLQRTRDGPGSELDLPGPLLVKGDSLKGHGSIAMATSGIVEKDTDFFHWGHCYTAWGGQNKSTLHAMWKTQKLICAQ